jgi:hypothetical protein
LRVNERISSFLGLNNLLDPASAEYNEGMAYSCTNARISRKGLWTGKPGASGGTVSETIQLTGGTGQRQMTVSGTSKLVRGIGCATEGQNGLIYYIDTGTLRHADSTPTQVTVAQSDVVAPTIYSVDADDSGSALCRIETGLYYYIVTDYNTVIKRESLPSYAYEVNFDADLNTRVHLVMSNNPPTNCTRRVYRADSESPNKFFYVGDIASGTTTFDDYKNQGELDVEYEGRGTVLTDPDFIVSYSDRMLYFKGNVLWWSSSGQPEEVAQKYTVHFISGAGTVDEDSQDMISYPKLSNGYGEARKEITEISGETITGAIEKDGKMWIFTKSMMGYLEKVNYGEGYEFKVFRRGVGALSQFVLQSCEFGIFGFDGQGMWLLDNANRVERLTDNRIDLSTFYDGSPAFNGIWCPNFNEYWMCNGTKVIPYQADRRIFVGHYTIDITAGCSWYDETGAWGLIGDVKIAEGTGQVDLIFYLGQSSPTTVKQQITVEAVQAGNASITVKVTPLPRMSITGLSPAPTEVSSGAIAATAVRATSVTTGRMIKAQISLTSSLNGGISTINYRYQPIQWSETDGR